MEITESIKAENQETPRQPEKKYRKRFGDRKDGRRLRTLEPMNVLIPFFMKERNDATNLVQESVELSAINSFVRAKKKEGKTNFNAMHVLIASYVRAVSQKPGINRFCSGQRVFARKNIEVAMEVKKKLELNAPATMLKFIFPPDATADEVYDQMSAKIEAFQAEVPNTNAVFEKIVHLIGVAPRWLLRGFISILKWLDYHGWLPQFFLDASPFHGSLVITSMGSLGIPSIYHHLYNFGNVPVFISFSTMRHENRTDKQGNITLRHYLDINFTTDERICDGHYYAACLHEIRKYLKDPLQLNSRPAQIVEDIL